MHQLLKHRYRILRVLSEAGAFGQTFLAEITDTPSSRRCVIKKLRPIADPQAFKLARERFRHEAAVLERLGGASDQIPKLYAYFVEHQEFYLVQELIEGPTLRETVRHGGRLREVAVRHLLIDLLSVLAYVHEQSVIHRDIKPDNIILRQCDNKPVLIDFGIVKEVLGSGDANPTISMTAGTPGYISLEQAAGRPVFASDLYSLGATAIFLLTGKNPGRLTDPGTGRINWREHAPAVSAEFAAVLDCSTEPYAHNRYQTARQMSAALRKSFAAGGRSAASRSTAAVEVETVVKPAIVHSPPSEPRRPSYALYFAIAAAALCLLAAIGAAAALARLGTESRAESVTARGETSSSKQSATAVKLRQLSTKKARVAEAKRTLPPASPHVTSTLGEDSQTPIEKTSQHGMFPEASTRLLTLTDIEGLSWWELRMMRNEIYARHGYIFKTPEMVKYFARQRWYSPRYEDVSRFLSEIEVQNVELIRSSE